MAAVVPAVGGGGARTALVATTPEQELRQRSHDDLVGLVRRLESDKLALMTEHSAVMREVNRRLQTHLVEIRALRDANAKVEDDARVLRSAREQAEADAHEAGERAAAEMRELRELCCFLDDERQRLRHLSGEWQRYGQHVATSGFDRGLGELTRHVAELERRQNVIVDENSHLRELCLFLDDERTAATAAAVTMPIGAQSTAATRGRGGSSSSDAAYVGHGSAATVADHGRGLGDGASSLTLAAAAGAAASGKHLPADDAAASYIRALEMRVQSLEQERNSYQKILEVHAQLERQPGAAVPVAATLTDGERFTAQLQQQSPAPSSGPDGGTGDASDQLGLTEKAIVRELCNVIWRKLADSRVAAAPPAAAPATVIAAAALAADSRVGPQGGGTLGSRLGPQGSSAADGDGAVSVPPLLPTSTGSDVSDGKAFAPTYVPAQRPRTANSSALVVDRPASAAATGARAVQPALHPGARPTFEDAPFVVANGPMVPGRSAAPAHSAAPAGAPSAAAGTYGPAYQGPQPSRNIGADRYTSFVVTGSSLVNGDRGAAAHSSSSADRHAGPAAAISGPPMAYGGEAAASSTFQGRSGGFDRHAGAGLPGRIEEAAVGHQSLLHLHAGLVTHGSGGGSAVAASASRPSMQLQQPLDVSSRSSSVSSTGSWSAPHGGGGAAGGSYGYRQQQPGMPPPSQPLAFFGAPAGGHSLYVGAGAVPGTELAVGQQLPPPLARPGLQQQQHYANTGLPGVSAAGSHVSYPYARVLP